MKLNKLIQQLEKIKAKHGDIDVMFQDPNSNCVPFEVSRVSFNVASEDEFPEDFHMPQGFKYVQLDN